MDNQILLREYLLIIHFIYCYTTTIIWLLYQYKFEITMVFK